MQLTVAALSFILCCFTTSSRQFFWEELKCLQAGSFPQLAPLQSMRHTHSTSPLHEGKCSQLLTCLFPFSLLWPVITDFPPQIFYLINILHSLIFLDLVHCALTLLLNSENHILKLPSDLFEDYLTRLEIHPSFRKRGEKKSYEMLSFSNFFFQFPILLADFLA